MHFSLEISSSNNFSLKSPLLTTLLFASGFLEISSCEQFPLRISTCEHFSLQVSTWETFSDEINFSANKNINKTCETLRARSRDTTSDNRCDLIPVLVCGTWRRNKPETAPNAPVLVLFQNCS